VLLFTRPTRERRDTHCHPPKLRGMTTKPTKLVRCAVCTRVSTEYGLDQFSSLDAQQEAAESLYRPANSRPAIPCADVLGEGFPNLRLQRGRRVLAHRTRHGRRPRRLLTEGTPGAGVTRPINR
jgi:hypothetical protein